MSGTGNFTRHEASDFLRHFAQVLGHGDTMLIGLDSCQDPAKVLSVPSIEPRERGGQKLTSGHT